MTVTQRIAELLREKNLQQLGLAKHINCTKSTMSYILSKNRSFGADDVIGIAEYLGVSVHFLLTGEEDPAEYVEQDKLGEDEQELLNIYRSVDREGKTAILYNAYQQRGRYKAFIGSQEKKKLENLA